MTAPKREYSMQRYLKARGSVVVTEPDRFCIDCQMHGAHRDGCVKATVAK